MKLTPDLTTLPLILTGPILRRVEARSVSVFIALKAFRRVTLQIYTQPEPNPGQPAEWAMTQDVKPIGKHLFVLLITLKIGDQDTPLQPGQNYFYDLRLEAADGSVQGLADLQLLNGSFCLGYTEGHLPGFAVPPGLDFLNVFHGSCRKPHGKGNDMLPLLDDKIAESRHAPGNRPHQLYLTGDQIYSDDVALALLKLLTHTGHFLLTGQQLEDGQLPPNATEMIHYKGADITPLSEQQIGPDRENRKNFLHGVKALSSTAKDGHLFFLAEFYAMYLFAWSDVLWPKEAGAVVLPEVFDLYVEEAPAADWVQSNHAAQQSEEVKKYAATLPRVRRALANVPVYMMFDDHEVTDDWYADGRWKQTALHDAVAKRVIRNGLIAYAVFQDWGNQPAKYQDLPAFWSKVEYQEAADTLPLFQQAAAMDDYLGLIPGQAPQTQWHYRMSFPEFDVYVLDQRTAREDLPEKPGLMQPAAISSLQLPAQDPAPEKLKIVVSPTPVFFLPIFEYFQEKSTVIIGPRTLDDEGWISNLPAWGRFLEKLAAFNKVVLLSGDVHCAYTINCAFFRKMNGAFASSRIIQLCSSGFKNIDKDFLTQKLNKMSGEIDQSYFKIQDELVEGDIMKKRLGNYQYEHQDQSALHDYERIMRISNPQRKGFFLSGHLKSYLLDPPGEDFDAMFRYRSVRAQEAPLPEGPLYIGDTNMGQIRINGDQLTHILYHGDGSNSYVCPISLPADDEKPPLD